MLGFALLILFFFSGFLDFPSVSPSIPSAQNSVLYSKSAADPFRDLLGAFKKWDSQVGCSQFRKKYEGLVKNGSSSSSSSSFLQDFDGELICTELKMSHVSVLVKGWTWIPDNLDNLYSCRCGLSCLWTKSYVLADKPDALLFETTTPPVQVLVRSEHGIRCFNFTADIADRVNAIMMGPCKLGEMARHIYARNTFPALLANWIATFMEEARRGSSEGHFHFFMEV
ncbi:GDP-fucose protein O-fucosyltransferase 2 [Sarracenia purpurea var. burkii]